jgi:tRNA (cytidine/uridine-2'-O-)-methyltransferase
MSSTGNTDPIFHIVLIEPEIPQNTGTIGRMCLAVGAQLHLIKPLAFDIDEKAVRRAGLDYWKHLKLDVHESLDDFFKTVPQDAQLVMVETRRDHTIYDVEFQRGCYLFFGKETTGIPKPLLEKYAKHIASIPMYDDRVRSLNLSNCASIVAYEAIRQIHRL